MDFHLILFHRVEIEKTATEGITGLDSRTLGLLSGLSRVKENRLLSLRRLSLLRLQGRVLRLLGLGYCIIASKRIEWSLRLWLDLRLSGCSGNGRLR